MGDCINYFFYIRKDVKDGLVSYREEYTIVERLERISNYWSEHEVLESIYSPSEAITYKNIKWHDYDENMKSLSIEFPNYWFILEGHENIDDWDESWCVIYHKGIGTRTNVQEEYPFNFREEEWENENGKRR